MRAIRARDTADRSGQTNRVNPFRTLAFNKPYGVLLGGRRTRPAKASLLVDPPQLPPRPVPIRYRKSVPTAWISVTVEEGLNRQVRRMTAAVGHPALRLVRVGIGPIMLGDLQPGEWRELSDAEVDSFRRV